MSDIAKKCPTCGTPVLVQESQTSPFGTMNKSTLERGKNTKAEDGVEELSANIAHYFDLVATFAIVLGIINLLISIPAVLGLVSQNPVLLVVFLPVIVAEILVIIYFPRFIRWIGRMIYSVNMLFFNMSTTLKRIEIRLAQEEENKKKDVG